MDKARSISTQVWYRSRGYTTTTAETQNTESAETAQEESGSGFAAGQVVVLDNTPLYVDCAITTPAIYRTGNYYIYDGILMYGRYRITNTPSRVGKTPVGENVTGWANASDLTAESEEIAEQTVSETQVETLGAGVGTDIAQYLLSLTYEDNAADSSDGIDITLDAHSGQWMWGWMPQKGATLYPCIFGHDWEKNGDERKIECGLFVVDDISFADTPTTMQIGGVSKPSDSSFSETERQDTWQNTSIKRIGAAIAERYGLGFEYDADDYDVECEEQDGTDSAFYNSLCGNYGLILKVYAKKIWVYDREKYKAKPPVKTIDRKDIVRGSVSWSTTLSGTYTGGTFEYTDADTDTDISCSVGGGERIMNVNRRATSEQDALVQLCADINNANHGATKLSFSLDGDFELCAGNTILITGYGDGPEGGCGINGKYFIDKVTHKISRSSGFSSALECSAVGESFSPGGDEEDSGESAGAVAEAGGAVMLDNAPFYYTCASEDVCFYRSGVYYFYDGIEMWGRYRITNTAERCGKEPVGMNVTGWVPKEYCV